MQNVVEFQPIIDVKPLLPRNKSPRKVKTYNIPCQAGPFDNYNAASRFADFLMREYQLDWKGNSICINQLQCKDWFVHWLIEY